MTKIEQSFSSGVLLHLTASGGLSATLPSGHSIPIADSAKGMSRLVYLLRRQGAAGLEALRAAKLAEPPVPTVAYLEHFEKHVAVEVPFKADGCPFCRASTIEPMRYEPMGEAARLSRKAKARAERARVWNPEDLGL